MRGAKKQKSEVSEGNSKKGQALYCAKISLWRSRRM